ncbi:hypothetical protein DDB_G0283787 [Dictyostelium discoideum AX4]|uniref:EGF-like domain-containing protein n=1 Tax=Dictyostelium discoideum TaxID=44689 RepID=Q54QK8_DICDI|nr:hypothetical protein DDB_G0283787 [Dictyostelium discoideum AX4]EAL65508.1 hypothetical protein DDB_G0283787 [Dictyostelium discoideum AX4]|eukprot:XP_638863.1 hypothetical protein DDB_G0283787 [Dictyostelium discoideum AX4]
MKSIFYYFYLLIFIVSLKLTIVKSTDEICLNNLLISFFGEKTNQYCTGGDIINSTGNLSSISVVCNAQYNIVELYIENNGVLVTKSLNYNDFNCFSGSLNTLKINGLPISADAFGTDMQTKVAQRIELTDCTFPDGRFSSVGNALANTTKYISIKINDNSNLNFVDFYSIKYLTYFHVTLNNSNVEPPTFSNTLQTSDKPSLSEVNLPLKNIPSFTYLLINSLSISLVGNSFTEAELLNLGTLNVTYLALKKENLAMDYPNSISSITKVIGLTVYGSFTARASGYSLPPNLNNLVLAPDVSFNFNGKFPFLGTLPLKLTSISIGSIGLTTFPDNFPPNIEKLSLNYNKMDPQTNLPDLSSFSKLKEVLLISNQFTGPIPNSYCLFKVSLNSNNLTGDWPQCLICFPYYNVNNLNGNPFLNRGTCNPGSGVPNLEYESSSKYFELYGENLGLAPPTIENQAFKDIIIPNSRFGYSWNEGLLGPVPDIVKVNISSKIYLMATKYLTPQISTITKAGNDFTFRGINFSYNKNQFTIKIAGVDCVISYIEYGIINCSNIDSVPLGHYVPGTLESQKSTEIITFYINTIDNKTSDIIKCNSDCNEPLGNGKCNTTNGICECTQQYTSDDCSLPNQFITSVSSVPTNGGVVDIWGWFGTIHSGLSIMIGQQVCQHDVNSITSSFINCTVGAGSGTQSITLTQNGITYTGNNMFHYTELTYSCPKDCSNNGKCNTNTGQCKCNSGWGGYDCNSKSSTGGETTSTSSTTGTTTPTSSPVIEIPKTNTTINGTDGSTVLNNQQTTYEISILSLIETDFSNNIVNTYNLSKKWDPVNITSNNIYKFTQTIQESCIITYTIEEVKTAREYRWAGLDLTLDKDSIKISVSIKNYTFNSVLNNLQLRFESLVGDNNRNTQDNNECNNRDTQVDTSEIDKNQLLNYVTISRNQKVLYGRFINRVISDSRQTFITTSVIPNNNNNNKQSVVIGLNLPHCTHECLIDPDFSVLVSSSYQECSSDLNNGGRASWVLPVAIVVPCVAVVLIIIIGFILFKKNRLAFLVAKNKMKGLKLKGLS